MFLIMKPFALLAIFLSIFSFDLSLFAQTANLIKKNIKTNTAGFFVKNGLIKGNKANRLIHEKSPYLLQHAFNPVNWYAWGDESFQKAREENKPIFLSIGYSTCHWCHVMARESFEDPKIAAIMNKYFISIKIDREERPDLDQIYMAVTQAMTGSGGWPMSLFLTPELKPFFAGTYFPPKSKYGRPGFPELLESINKAWQEDSENIALKADDILAALKRVSASNSAEKLDNKVFGEASRYFRKIFDQQHGGFGQAPKFPRPATLLFLLRHYKRNNDLKSREMVLNTLKSMAEGGIYDHIGGGFHRYSVDEMWRVPHFEKMLYDQALLTTTYLEAYQVSKNLLYKRVAIEVLDYVLKEMSDEYGGFYSAEDADSPFPDDPTKHGEGAFYLWQKKEIDMILPPIEASIFSQRFGVKDGGNAPADPQNEFINKNILFAASSPNKIATKIGKSPKETELLLDSALIKMHAVRAKRPRPHLDDKVLTSWNGLMISALAKGYQVIGDRRYLEAAEKSTSFIFDRLYDSDKQVLYHRYRDGEVGIEATLDDYAFLVQGLLDLFEASFSFKWLNFAESLTIQQIALFEDTSNGGFFDTSGQDSSVLIRMKSSYDGAEPAGNSIAALNLMRLGQITAREKFTIKGQKTVDSFASQITRSPSSMPQMLAAFDYQAGKPLQIIIAGKKGAPDTEKMLSIIGQTFLPSKIILLTDDSLPEEMSKRLPFLKFMKMINGKATAYVCKNYTCQSPTNKTEVLQQTLAAKAK